MKISKQSVILCLALVASAATGAPPIGTSEKTGKKTETGGESRMTSFLPTENLERFIVERIDLTSFGTSLAGNSDDYGKRHFKEFGIQPTKIEKGFVELETAHWYFSLRILRRGDENADGIEDLVIRFDDDSKEGTYLTADTYLFTRLSKDGNLIALAYKPRRRGNPLYR